MQMQNMSFPSQREAHASADTASMRLITLLGTGSTSSVFLAEHSASPRRAGSAETSTEVAVKVPRPGVSLEREARALRKFSHPNIIELIEDRTATNGSLVLGLCSGGTLEDVLAEGKITVNDLRRLVTEVAEALFVIHESRWIHGDVNPSNIGLRRNSAAVLIDFGTCRPATDQAPSQLTEEFAGRPTATTPTLDVRSLAATARTALSSAPLFASSTPGAIEEAVDPEAHLIDPLIATLTDFITRGDSGAELTLDELIAIFGVAPYSAQARESSAPETSASGTRVASVPPEPIPDAPLPAQPQRSGGGIPRGPRTRNFGPGSGGDDDVEAIHESQQRLPDRPVLLGAAFVAMLLVGFLVGIEVRGAQDGALPETSAHQPLPDATPTTHLRADATLAAADAEWLSDRGSLHILRDGTPTTFVAGVAGDQGAIADWDCDGVETLGVFRPSTGAWFTFTDWSENAVSTSEMLTEPGYTEGQLIVAIDDAGCGRPLLDAANS